MSKFAIQFMMKFVIALNQHMLHLEVESEVLLGEVETLVMVLSQDMERLQLQFVGRLHVKNVKMFQGNNARMFQSRFPDKNARMFQDKLVELFQELSPVRSV